MFDLRRFSWVYKNVKWQHSDGTWWTHQDPEDPHSPIVQYSEGVHGARTEEKPKEHTDLLMHYHANVPDRPTPQEEQDRVKRYSQAYGFRNLSDDAGARARKAWSLAMDGKLGRHMGRSTADRLEELVYRDYLERYGKHVPKKEPAAVIADAEARKRQSA